MVLLIAFSSPILDVSILFNKKSSGGNPQSNMEQNPRKDKKDDTTVGRSEVVKFVWRTSDGSEAILSLSHTPLPFGRKSHSVDPVKPQGHCR